MNEFFLIADLAWESILKNGGFRFDLFQMINRFIVLCFQKVWFGPTKNKSQVDLATLNLLNRRISQEPITNYRIRNNFTGSGFTFDLCFPCQLILLQFCLKASTPSQLLIKKTQMLPPSIPPPPHSLPEKQREREEWRLV